MPTGPLASMSAFGPKRKARIIQTLDDDDMEMTAPPLAGDEDKKEASVPVPQGPIKFGRTKPAKSSSLRKSINFNDDDPASVDAGGASTAPTSAAENDDDAFGPVVIRPALSRSGSTKQKKRPSSATRLSFGPDSSSLDEGDVATAEVITPKKTLGHRALQNNALRKSASLQNLHNIPTRFGAEDDRPRYSKEYLSELQSSTPNTPVKPSTNPNDDSLMDIDPSELEGALIVPSSSLPLDLITTNPPSSTPQILTDSQIRERKERRARLAQQQPSTEFISLSGSESDTPRSKPNKKTESRLIAEDEDLGEGYDEFVSDGSLALGRKAELQASRRHRQEMAELIRAAEEDSAVESDDSEAERRAAYEAAQRRAGMDGLRREDEEGEGEEGVGIVPRMKALPDVRDVIERMRGLVKGLEEEVGRRRGRVEELEREREDIERREREVQGVLDMAGKKYLELGGGMKGDFNGRVSVGQSPLRGLPGGIGEVSVERGLESFGTPTKRDGGEDEDEGDVEMV